MKLKEQVVSTPQESNRIIFAIDQSISAIGFSVWEDYKLVHFGCFNPEYSEVSEERIIQLFSWVSAAIKDIKEKKGKEITVVIKDVHIINKMEGAARAFDNKSNVVLAFKVSSQLMGAIIGLCYQEGLDYYIMKPSEWKDFVGVDSSYKTQQKAEAIDLLQILIDEVVEEPEVDAVCMGYTYVKKNS